MHQSGNGQAPPLPEGSGNLSGDRLAERGGPLVWSAQHFCGNDRGGASGHDTTELDQLHRDNAGRERQPAKPQPIYWHPEKRRRCWRSAWVRSTTRARAFYCRSPWRDAPGGVCRQGPGAGHPLPSPPGADLQAANSPAPRAMTSGPRSGGPSRSPLHGRRSFAHQSLFGGCCPKAGGSIGHDPSGQKPQ